MATVEIKSLADGTLPSTKGTLYTATEETAVKLVTLFNRNTTAELAVIYIKRSGSTSVEYIRTSLDTNEREISSESLPLSAGDLIEGVTTTAAKVAYFIGGAVKTA
jgi:hypothetical protein